MSKRGRPKGSRDKSKRKRGAGGARPGAGRKHRGEGPLVDGETYANEVLNGNVQAVRMLDPGEIKDFPALDDPEFNTKMNKAYAKLQRENKKKSRKARAKLEYDRITPDAGDPIPDFWKWVDIFDDCIERGREVTEEIREAAKRREFRDVVEPYAELFGLRVRRKRGEAAKKGRRRPYTRRDQVAMYMHDGYTEVEAHRIIRLRREIRRLNKHRDRIGDRLARDDSTEDFEDYAAELDVLRKQKAFAVQCLLQVTGFDAMLDDMRHKCAVLEAAAVECTDAKVARGVMEQSERLRKEISRLEKDPPPNWTAPSREARYLVTGR